jgi:hypothetical protein
LIWAFKPTDVINIRHLPAETQHEAGAMIGDAQPRHREDTTFLDIAECKSGV